jgi:hypothetical protein
MGNSVASEVKLGLTLRLELELMLGDAAFKVVCLGVAPHDRRHFRAFSPTAQVIVVGGQPCQIQ